MFDVTPIGWVSLLAPAIFAFAVGGGFWAHCARRAASPAEAAAKFKVYGWAIWPAASLGYAAALVGAMDAAGRASLASSLALAPETTALAVVVGIVLAALTIAAIRPLTHGAAKPSRQFLASEFRELPGLVIIAPIAEEFIFRYHGARIFADAPEFTVALITSLAFALIHFKPWQIALSFVAGLAFFALYRTTGSLSAAMVAHAIANAGAWLWMRREAARLMPAAGD